MRVSVAMSAWNAAWCIERGLDSVFAQSRVPDEVILSDDGSTDDTVARVERRYGDRVRILRLPHQGVTLSRGAALAAATGDWLALLDADDWWRPAKIERQLHWIAQHPEARWVSSDGDFVGTEGTIRASWLSDYFQPVRDLSGDLMPPLIERCFPLTSSVMIERQAFIDSGGFDPAIQFTQDYELWLKLAARHSGGLIAEPLITYWSSPGGLSRRIEERHRDDLTLMRRVESGVLRNDPILKQRGAERAAALEFDLALTCLRSDREAEARERFARAAAAGPWRRRALAGLGGALPVALLRTLARSSAARRAVGGARHARRTIDAPAVQGEGE